jgi:hypothetical protein
VLQLSRDQMGFLPLLYYSPAALIWGSACAYGRLWRECRHASHLLVVAGARSPTVQRGARRGPGTSSAAITDYSARPPAHTPRGVSDGPLG